MCSRNSPLIHQAQLQVNASTLQQQVCFSGSHDMLRLAFTIGILCILSLSLSMFYLTFHKNLNAPLVQRDYF